MATQKTNRIYDDYSTLTPVHEGIDLTHLRRLVAEERMYHSERPAPAVPPPAETHGKGALRQADWSAAHVHVDRAKGNRHRCRWQRVRRFHFGDTPAILGHSPTISPRIADQLLNRADVSAPTEDDRDRRYAERARRAGVRKRTLSAPIQRLAINPRAASPSVQIRNNTVITARTTRGRWMPAGKIEYRWLISGWARIRRSQRIAVQRSRASGGAPNGRRQLLTNYSHRWRRTLPIEWLARRATRNQHAPAHAVVFDDAYPNRGRRLEKGSIPTSGCRARALAPDCPSA